MKKIIIITALILAGTLTLSAQQAPDPAGVIINHYAARAFTAGAVPKADLDLILQAGVRAPSARNLQPWHFTVVQNIDLAKKIIAQTIDGNVLIVISAAGDSKTNYVEIIDCSLATQSIYLQAQSLGYGSRIYTAPIDNLNKNYKKDLGLPVGYSAVAVVRVGKIDKNTDAVSSASPRKAAETMINYK